MLSFPVCCTLFASGPIHTCTPLHKLAAMLPAYAWVRVFKGVQELTEGAQHNDLHLQLAQALAVARVGLQLLQVLPHVQGYCQARV